MKKDEFLNFFNKGVKEFLKTGVQYNFKVFEAPSDGNQFLRLCNEFTSYRPDYKGLHWIDYDERTKSVSLNSGLTINNNIFIGNQIPDYIDTLNYSDYEAVASLMIQKLLGDITMGKNYESRDEGIDFYGFCSPGISEYGKFLNQYAWYIGQVKCYASKIKTNYLRELLGTVTLAKNGIWALDGRYTDKLEVANYDHIVPMFIAKSFYSKDSINLAKKYNIKLFDNLDLIFWLIIFYEKDIALLKRDLIKVKNNLP